MALPDIFGGFETRQKQFFIFQIFFFQEKSVFFRENIGFFPKNRRFFSDLFTSDFSFPKSFPTKPKTDFSPKNRLKKTIFLSLHISNTIMHYKITL